ncbi:MAG: carbohydrate-binding domain-containing protein [Calditrichaceae bacterium]
MYNKIYVLLIFSLVTTGFIACQNSTNADDTADETETTIVDDAKSHDDAGDYIWDSSEEIPIMLNGNSITVDGNGAIAEGSILAITSAGSYNISGSLEDGRIVVDTDDNEIVRLILNNVDINCSTHAPVYVEKAARVMIVLADNSENYLKDGSSYTYANTDVAEPNAAVFSKADLTFYGNGSLTVFGNYNDGISGKDGLIITSGNIRVHAVDDGIRGKDYLIVKDGNITVDAAGIGLKSDNADDASMGYITIEKGVIDITASSEAIAAQKDVDISSGEISISSGGQGINGSISVTIDGGTITINSGNDGIHSDGLITINDGILTISCDDDAIHADYDLVINGGEINIEKSFEGIESVKGDITVNGGEIHIVSSDDGINLAAESGSYIYVNGGYIVVNADGDGIDANSSILMTDGTLLVSGSSDTSSSALDYDGTFEMNGGFLVAAGSYFTMTKAPCTSSEQYCILVNFNSTKDAGTLIHMESQSGEEILTFSPAKSYQSVVFSSSKLVKGTSYNVYTGGSCTGTSTDGLYKDGTYAGGSLYKSLIISDTITIVN